jgi:hypothetical protein
MPPRTRAQEDTATEDTSATDAPLETFGKSKFVVLSGAVTIEYAPENGNKKARVGRAHQGQIVTLDMGVVNGEKIQRLIDLKALAPYEEGAQYAATTARVATAAAGARPDPVVAPVVPEQELAPASEPTPADDDPDEETEPGE